MDRKLTTCDTHDDSCKIDTCARPVREYVEHPQRGRMAVCPRHATRIRALPLSRFVETGVVR